MNDNTTRFETLVRETLAPYYCTNPRLGFEPDGFDADRKIPDPVDVAHFLRAWDLGLLRPLGEGRYGSVRGSASETLFWEGRKADSPRRFWLWLEPLITFGGLAKLHDEFGWPIEMIGTQSPDYAFDIVAYPDATDVERIAGEVKKSRREVDQLLEMMVEYGGKPDASALAGEKGRNAYKKVEGLRARRAPVFWALGPAGYNRTFSVLFEDDGTLQLKETDISILMCPHLDFGAPPKQRT